jgi:hypothetical protein
MPWASMPCRMIAGAPWRPATSGPLCPIGHANDVDRVGEADQETDMSGR